MNEKDTRELAYTDWVKGMKPKQLSEKYEVSINTVKSWITRHWKNKTGAPENKKKVHPIITEGAPQKAQSTTPAPIEKQIVDAVEENEELTDKQKEFCAIYMTNFNATQAYLKAYGCTYAVANTAGPRLLVNVRIQDEIRALKEIKNAALGNLSGDDVVELHMRIAFANMNDFAEFTGQYIPIVSDEGERVELVHPKTKEKIPLFKAVNLVKFRNSKNVDGQLINEVSVGRDGARVKLKDSQKSMQFLERYFKLNPSDGRKKEYDNLRGELEGKAVSVNISVGDDEL